MSSWLNFTQDTGIHIKEDKYHGFHNDLHKFFNKSNLMLNTDQSYVTDHPRTIYTDDKNHPINCYMPYTGSFYGTSPNDIETDGSVKDRLENFVAYLNRKHQGVILCDVLPFSPHGPDTMAVVFYDAYKVNPSIFEHYSIMRITGKNCDPTNVDLYVKW